MRRADIDSLPLGGVWETILGLRGLAAGGFGRGIGRGTAGRACRWVYRNPAVLRFVAVGLSLSRGASSGVGR